MYAEDISFLNIRIHRGFTLIITVSNYIYHSSAMSNLSTQDAVGAATNLLDYVQKMTLK